MSELTYPVNAIAADKRPPVLPARRLPVVRLHDDGRLAVHHPGRRPELPKWSVSWPDGRHEWRWDGDVIGPGWSPARIERAAVPA